jgi:hypothetical protein
MSSRIAASLLGVWVLLALVGASRADDAPPATPPAAEKAPDLVEPTAELAPHLAPFDAEAEPGRELKRGLIAVAYYLLAGDVDRAVQYFHPDLQFHVGSGDLEPMPPAQLRGLFEEQQRERQREGGPRPKLTDVVDLGHVRAYSRERALEVDAEAEGWETVEPAQIARLMREGDWLVMARLRGGDWGRELFYVFRKDGPRFKVVLAE